jgi:hypothetical protein
MSVSSISSGSSTISQVQPKPNLPPQAVGDGKNDGDSDDGSKAAGVTASTKPTVNTNGQTIGSTISVKA